MGFDRLDVIFAALLFYALTVIGLFALRARRSDLPRPVRALGYPWLPVLYVALTGLICVNLLLKKPLYTWPGLIIVCTGIPVFFLWRGSARPSPSLPNGSGELSGSRGSEGIQERKP